MRILKNLSWIFFASLFASFAKWLIVIMIAKNLSATEVGIYSLAFAIGAPITLFANMRLRSLFITSIEDDISDYLYTRNILSVIVFIVLLIIAVLFYPKYSMVIILVGLGKIINLQSDIYYSIPHKNSELNIIGKMIIVKQFLLLFSFGISIFIFKNLIYALLVQVIFQVVFFVFIERRYILKKYRITIKKPSYTGIKSILLLGLPLGFVQMIYSINSNYSRYVLEYFESAEVLGYFSALMYIAIVANLFMNSISQVFLPRLSNLYKTGKISLFKKYIIVYLSSISLVLGSVLISLSYFFGEHLLTIIYGPEYALYSYILVLITVSVSINIISWNFDTALMAMRYISIQPKITTVNLLLTVIIGYLLISQRGIEGAAFTMIISAFTQLIMRAYFVNKRLNSK